ncbi:F-box/LRR-repeat protein fbxl-1-like isoform X1 [Neodiprion fabricii]|uniref:F-box/LRR-repeat protein fbxl-1-like isoform X1 n=2 Tax=Neodiprion fabricii TaxID=2872261 RepID=UPI001ED8CE31|nr:F-box/LRR-repeat protein fbxl-1-like isoform X1 [Neodiprion fabricii]
MDRDEILRHVCEVMTRVYVYSYKDELNDSEDECYLSATEDGVPIRKLFIGNLAQRTTVKDLQNVFSKYGKVDSCYLKRNSGKSNYAFVTFSTVDDAMKARRDGSRKEIHLHNRDLRVMPADSWHQPDSVENQRKVAARKDKTQQHTETNDCLFQPYIPIKDSLEDDAPIHKLNDDCLIHVFLHLPITDRVRIERVCKRWHAVSLESWRAVKRLDLSLSAWGYIPGKRDPSIDTPTLRKVLLRCGHFLNHIDLSQISHRLRQSTLTIIGKFCPNLQTIDTTSLNVSSAGIDSLTKNCGDIRKLVLGSCTSSCDNDLIKLFSKNKKLKSLKIVQNSLLTGKCLVHLPADGIEEISLAQCNAVSSCSFSNAIAKFSNLSSLSLNRCVSLCDYAIWAIASRVDSLKDLELWGYFPLLTTNAMSHVANLVNLERLNVGWNPVVTNNFLLAVAAQCVLLKRIDLTGCNTVTDEGIAAIASLPKLNELLISYMGHVSDDALPHMHQLKHLECRGCPRLTDSGTSALIQVCPQLELLDLSGCDCITNSTLEVAVKATKVRTNNSILKIIVGGTGTNLDELIEISPLLQIVNVDLSHTHMRPDFDHGRYFPSEDDDSDKDDFFFDLADDRNAWDDQNDEFFDDCDI